MMDPNILVIDDSLTSRMKLKELLEEEGAHVEVAETGEQGTALARQMHPDVIILDVVLSDCDGITLCQSWQKDPELKYTPVLLVSGERAGQDDRVAGLKSGAMGYVVKPFAVQEVLAQVNMLYHLGKTQNQLRRRAMDLSRSNQDLQEFAYVISNDLMEPLRMVSSYMEMLEDRYGKKFDDEANTFIQYAVDGAHRMQKLVQDLLEYSRVKNKSHQPTRIDCGESVDKACEKLKKLIKSTKAKVTHKQLPAVFADPDDLTQIFETLFDNALKFRSKKPPRIEVSAAPQKLSWKISVKDNGVGIEPDQKERIFGVFQRIHTEEQHTGSGIGLAICKRLVERQGGKISVASTPGEGSTFHFTLPAHDSKAIRKPRRGSKS